MMAMMLMASTECRSNAVMMAADSCAPFSFWLSSLSRPHNS